MALPEFALAWRNRLLAHPGFLKLAQRVAFMRPVARAKALKLFDLLAGFSYSQVLYACVASKAIEQVGLGGLPTAELVRRLALPEEKALVLIRAAAALDIFTLRGQRVFLGALGAQLLAQPWIGGFVLHHNHFYRDLEDPLAMLGGKPAPGGLQDYWSYTKAEADKSAYSKLMAASQAAVSEQILARYDFTQHRNMLDIGGGTGAFLRAVGQAHPQLKLNLFDLEGVVRLSPAHPRLTCHAGDFRLDPLPTGMDLISLVRVVHDHDDAVVLALLRKIRAVCRPETILLIAEPFGGNPATARVADAYFSLYFAAMGQGRMRSPAEIAALGAEAGFGGLKLYATDLPLITGLLSLHPTGA